MQAPFFEDLEVGDIFESPELPIYSCEVDMFYLITEHGGIHMDRDLAQKNHLKDRVVPGLQLLGFINRFMRRMGLLVNVGMLLGVDKVKFMHPVFPADQLHVSIKVLKKKNVEKWKDRGIITYECTMFNQDKALIMTAEFNMQYIKREPKPGPVPAAKVN